MKFKKFTLFGRKFTIKEVELGQEEKELIGNLYSVSCNTLGDDLVTVYKLYNEWCAVKPNGSIYTHKSIYDACKKALVNIC